ncbi:hypothetical protein AMTRI_Chr02g265490 [Amborella trichopoda]
MENREFWGFSNKGKVPKKPRRSRVPLLQQWRGNRRKIDSFSTTTMENGRIFGFTNKTKFYQCPYCYMVFGSDQALGGHRRSHGA